MCAAKRAASQRVRDYISGSGECGCPRWGGAELGWEGPGAGPGPWVGKYDFDRDIIFMNIDDAAELFGFPWGSATAVYGWVPDPFAMEAVTRKLAAELPGCQIETWQTLNAQLLGVLAVEKNMMFFLLIFIVLVAAFSIANTLITSVYQKTREIGLVKALGGGRWQVMNIFMLQGLLVGVAGSFAGTLFGCLVIHGRHAIMHAVSQITGQPLFPPEMYFFNELPAHIVPGVTSRHVVGEGPGAIP